MQDIYVFDLDGTIADCRHRRHLVNDRPNPDWNKFWTECVNDTPHMHIINIMKALKNSGYFIAILSGRNDMVEKETVEWLQQYNVPVDYIHMRPSDDFRPDIILKKSMMQKLETYAASAESLGKVVAVFDDRQKVVDMWRREGYICYQVAEGNF